MSLLKDKIELEVEMAELRAQESLNQFPKVLRWILVGCILAAIPAYFLAKSLSYSYWDKQYSGYRLTAKPSFTEAKEPTISPVTLGSTGNGNYSAVVQVKNNNLDLSLAQAPYEFVFYNDKSEQLYRETGTTFFLPNEQKFLVVPRFTSKDAVSAADFRFTAELKWQKRLSIPKAEIRPSTPDPYNQLIPPAFVVEGNYLNNSPYQLGAVRLTFIIYDRSGKIIGASRRDDFTVAPYERRTYKQIWPQVYADPGYTVKVFAETNVFDAKNLTLPEAPAGSAADLSR